MKIIQQNNIREDIQILRAIAVLAVVFYHSSLSLVPEGYLGVDIFFVISGFLISNHIIGSLQKNSFSFLDFYRRRAIRLFPALYSTLLVSLFVSAILLTPAQWQNFLAQFLGAMTFTANLVLPTQSGYFASAAETKILLHTWSLSLEEQFYFLLPMILLLTPKRFWLHTILLLLSISLIFCFSWTFSANQEAPFLWRIGDAKKFEWAFFLLPTRMWELLAGTFAAYIMARHPGLKIKKPIKLLALSTLSVCLFFKFTPEHPSVEAVVIVLATFFLLLGDDNWVTKNFLSKLFRLVGDSSYSIYLVHWPIICFAHISYSSPPPFIVSVAIIPISVLLGWLQYSKVENFFRANVRKISWLSITSTFFLMTAIPSYLLFFQEGNNDVSKFKPLPNYGLDSGCELSLEKTPKTTCFTEPSPTVAIWGDSYAMHLVQGLRFSNPSLVQLTKPYCGPFLKIAPVNNAYPRHWAHSCITHNERSLEYIVSNSSIKYVVLSSALTQYLSENTFLMEGETLKRNSLELFEGALQRTISLLEASGKKVIFASPPPATGKDYFQCHIRQEYALPLLAESCDIDLPQTSVLDEKAIALQLIEDRVDILSIEQLMCKERQCKTKKSDIILYKDTGHLSVDGSKNVLKHVLISEN